MGKNSWLNLFIFLLIISLSIRFGIRLLMLGLRFWYITLPVFLVYFYLIKPKKIDNAHPSNQTYNNSSGKEIYIDPEDYSTSDINETEDRNN